MLSVRNVIEIVEQITATKKDIEKERIENIELSEPSLPTSGLFASKMVVLENRLTELRDSARFDSPMAFLIYEIKTSLDDKNKLLEHFEQALPCKNRFYFILQNLGISIEQLKDERPIRHLVQSNEFIELMKNEEFLNQWSEYENTKPKPFQNYIIQ